MSRLLGSIRGRVGAKALLVSACAVLAGCASFSGNYAEKVPAERQQTYQDQVGLWDFLSGGHLENAKHGSFDQP